MEKKKKLVTVSELINISNKPDKFPENFRPLNPEEVSDPSFKVVARAFSKMKTVLSD
tara:strand:+ start:12904 stop:13074 length:171 start_codon:yes stop_codon:yes gene_type:complete